MCRGGRKILFYSFHHELVPGVDSSTGDGEARFLVDGESAKTRGCCSCGESGYSACDGHQLGYWEIGEHDGRNGFIWFLAVSSLGMVALVVDSPNVSALLLNELNIGMCSVNHCLFRLCLVKPLCRRFTTTARYLDFVLLGAWWAGKRLLPSAETEHGTRFSASTRRNTPSHFLVAIIEIDAYLDYLGAGPIIVRDLQVQCSHM